PAWATESAGSYTVQAKATDKAGNTFTGSAVSFTLLSNSAAPAGTVADTTGAASLQINNVTSAVGRTQFVEVAMDATTSSVTVTTSQADELLVGAIGLQDGRATFDPGTNFTALTPINANGPGGQVIFPEYRIVHATGAYSATATNNNSKPGPWAAAIVTYKYV